VIQGRKLRVDATCVQTTIHHPTDSGLLVDSVRVLSRFVKRAKPLVEEKITGAKEVCRSRLRSARQVAQQLHRLLRRTNEQHDLQEKQQKSLYQQLVHTTEQMIRQAEQVVQGLGQQTERMGKKLIQQAEQVMPLVKQVIAQTRVRVIEDKKAAASDKVLSLFEPHTRVIPRAHWGCQC
jgi:transposase, IS5 family